MPIGGATARVDSAYAACTGDDDRRRGPDPRERVERAPGEHRCRDEEHGERGEQQQPAERAEKRHCARRRLQARRAPGHREIPDEHERGEHEMRRRELRRREESAHPRVRVSLRSFFGASRRVKTSSAFCESRVAGARMSSRSISRVRERAQRDVARVEKEHGSYAAVGKLPHHRRADRGEAGRAGGRDEEAGERGRVAQRGRRDSGEIGGDLSERDRCLEAIALDSHERAA